MHPSRLAPAVIVAALFAGACGSIPSEPFEDVTGDAGLDFDHANGMTGGWYLPEIMGAGGALFDLDDDGDLDLYLVQGGRLEADPVAHPSGDRLFRNEWIEQGRLRLTDVTATADLGSGGYGMGVTTGDYDGDGHVDLYVTAFGPNRLLRNRGDGTFEDVTAASGADDPRWSSAATFLDYDGDGRLDLFVTNYVDFRVGLHQPCRNPAGRIDYCSPLSFEPYPDRLLRNLGDGTFADATADSRIASAYGAGLGVVATDFDGDGALDLFVANDGSANQLWINRRDGTFEDRALIAGCAFNRDGKPEAGMGVDLADFDDDGDLDLFLVHLGTETNTLYRNRGDGWFEDATHAAGLAAVSLPYTGFGTAWIDVDADGRLDLVVANGAVTTLEAQRAAGEPLPLRQRNQLFLQQPSGNFAEFQGAAAGPFGIEEIGRGLAVGDLDNDGDADLLLTNNSGPARLLLNRAADGRRWIGFRLTDRAGRHDPRGALVELTVDGVTRRRAVRRDGSYLSAHDPRVRFGLGDSSGPFDVWVRWPDGSRELFSALQADRYHGLEQGGAAR